MFYIEHGYSHRLIPNAPIQNNFRQRKHEWICYADLLNPSVQCSDTHSRLKIPVVSAQDIIKDV